MIIPASREEMEARGWDRADIILVSGDAYIDSPSMGVTVVGTILAREGFRVAVITQPDMDNAADITSLGEPRLFWGVSGGSVDSMVANYTASGIRRKSDDFTPGGLNTRRPDRAVIAYSNLIRRHFRKTVPIVLGGIEASLRRVAHYDFWSNKIRRSILFDAKADYLLYGMADRSIVELAGALNDNRRPDDIRGLCYIAKEVAGQEDDVVLPSFDKVAADTEAFAGMFNLFYLNNDPVKGRRLIQKHGDRYLVHNPPPLPLEEKELDRVYALDYSRNVHPASGGAGPVKALDTIRFSVTSHRGCYGECNFCAIAVHQGQRVTSRSMASIVGEVEGLTRHPLFRGTVHDIGGATANMYGIECRKKIARGACTKKRCLFPAICKEMPVDHGRQRELLRAVRKVDKVKRVFVASGMRYDMVLHDDRQGSGYLQDIVRHHVSGQLKIAPEHSEKRVLELMGKPDTASLLKFKKKFDDLSKKEGKKQFLTYYFIAAHPGCRMGDMKALQGFVRENLKMTPEQVQIFTPTPSTYSTLMYVLGKDPFSDGKIPVERLKKEKVRQKKMVQREFKRKK